MTNERTNKSLAVTAAFIIGKTIQYKRLNEVEWLDVLPGHEPCWNWESNDYRIKPEPEQKPIEIEVWVNQYGVMARDGAMVHGALAEAGFTKRKFREVL